MIHCPECGSDNVECISTKAAHVHNCLDCGYCTTAAPVRR